MIPNKLIGPGQRSQIKSEQGLVLFGVALKDAREEHFVLMVCDGLPMGLAFKRAGFESKAHDAPSNLFHLPRVQERAQAILEARRKTGVVSLPEVTSMLQRVFAGAHSEGEYSAAHNAAFSLARLYGHVTDRQTIEVMRRPSRDPDAPSEQMLEDWAASLPLVGSSSVPDPQISAPQGPPAPLLGPGPPRQLDLFDMLTGGLPAEQSEAQSLTISNTYEHPSRDDRSRDAVSPGVDGEGETGNGAPVGPVTGTPDARGGTTPLEKTGSPFSDEGTCPEGGEQNRADNSTVNFTNREKVAIEGVTEAPNVPIGIPSEARSEPAKPAEYPSFDELFG